MPGPPGPPHGGVAMPQGPGPGGPWIYTDNSIVKFHALPNRNNKRINMILYQNNSLYMIYFNFGSTMIKYRSDCTYKL